MRRITGKVSFYTDYRGFGFIDAGDKEYFVHTTSLLDNAYLVPGDEVEFSPVVTRKGLAAVDVRVMSRDTRGEREKEKARWVFMKKNPFTPQDPVVDPERFAGRRSQVANAIDALYNGKNILITGPRGIGKSSIGYQLLYLANGDNKLATRLDIDLGGESFDRLIGDHRCTAGNSLATISTSLIATLQANIGRRFTESGRVDVLEIDLKYFKIGETTALEKITSGDLAGMFAIEVDQILRSCDHTHGGVVFLIDEIDTLEDSIELAPFLKSVTERLRLQNHLNVSFVLSGVTGSITSLVLQHPSAGRLLENLSVGPMEPDELHEIIDLSLKDSGVDITERAKKLISSLANNFPQPVQLIGYHAFRLDADGTIDDHDVEAAKRFVVENVKQQEFQDRFGKLLQGGTRSVARAFAISKYETVGVSYLKHHCKNLTIPQLVQATAEMVRHDIIEQVDINTWKFRDPLFRIYFRMALGIGEQVAAAERARTQYGARSRGRQTNSRLGSRSFNSRRRRPGSSES